MKSMLQKVKFKQRQNPKEGNALEPGLAQAFIRPEAELDFQGPTFSSSHLYNVHPCLQLDCRFFITLTLLNA